MSDFGISFGVLVDSYGSQLSSYVRDNSKEVGIARKQANGVWRAGDTADTTLRFLHVTVSEKLGKADVPNCRISQLCVTGR